tara:strand:+ start:2817 stop:3644 length:828 start_codon:yes stop_codon:yes gene_type:complete
MNIDYQYIELLHSIFQYGQRRTTRNATTLSIFGVTLHMDLSKGFPLLTTKKMFFKGVVTELAWFLRGSTDVTELHEHNNHIWDGNTKDRDFDAGPVYGFQWRHFGADYISCKEDYTGQGIDQIEKIIHLIKTNPHSRRIYLSAWNPMDEEEMCLPPCHVSYQFYVQSGKLYCQMYQRSADVFLGLPFNIASTALLVHLIAHECDLQVGSVRIVVGDAHIYENHVGVATLQTQRIPFGLPTLTIRREKDGLRDVKWKDIKLTRYQHHSALKAKMVA